MGPILLFQRTKAIIFLIREEYNKTVKMVIWIQLNLNRKILPHNIVTHKQAAREERVSLCEVSLSSLETLFYYLNHVMAHIPQYIEDSGGTVEAN